jgi:hypothetical protein
MIRWIKNLYNKIKLGNTVQEEIERAQEERSFHLQIG